MSAARNTGLDHAGGELVAYCDDDNTMGPQWLQAVVWAASRHPEVDVFYGAQVLEDGRPRRIGRGSPWPVLALEPFDRKRLARENFIDQGVLAHRRDLSEAHFDETLPACVDWDLVVRLTADRDPVAVPVVASRYSTSADGRISAQQDIHEAHAAVRARARSRGPLRVLAYNAMFPLLSETYIADEIEALAQCGAQVAFSTAGKRTAPMPVDRPCFTDLDEAVAKFEPDLLLLHWATFAREQRAVLGRHGLPYACRVHSFDADPGVVAEVVADPNCIGVWAYPHIAEHMPGTSALPTLFTAHDQLPAPAAERDLVLSVSAGLPKKDWDLLLDAFARLEGVPRRIVIGTTAEHEDLPTKLVLRLQEQRDPPLLQVNLTRDQVFSLLARAAVLVYTLEPGQTLRQPEFDHRGVVLRSVRRRPGPAGGPADDRSRVPRLPRLRGHRGPHARGARRRPDDRRRAAAERHPRAVAIFGSPASKPTTSTRADTSRALPVRGIAVQAARRSSPRPRPLERRGASPSPSRLPPDRVVDGDPDGSRAASRGRSASRCASWGPDGDAMMRP